LLHSNSVLAQSASDILQSALTDFQNSPDLSAANYSFREFAENFPILKLERAPSRLPPSNLKISSRARDLIIAFEVSSKSAYEQRYQKPTWPGGRSGVTIGIGYDIGYVRSQELQADWREILADTNALAALQTACGVTGGAAQELTPRLFSIAISWDKAEKEFDVEIPKYTTLTQTSLPNFAMLSEDCRGVLVSLVYNRGPSFDVLEESDGSGRYREMRNIKKHMTEKTFTLIPNEIKGMSRLWPGVAGLIRRRAAEAALFDLGLSAN
jgi:GH24 family phage-related lysozyme (muramidase)